MNQFEYENYLNNIRNNYYQTKNVFDNYLNLPYQEKQNYNPLEKLDININGNMMLFDIKEGFEKGNLFKNLYEAYKHYKPRDLKPKNEQEELFLKIEQLAFAMHEVNLYLNVFPNDQNMINKYNEWQKEYNHILKHYESKYAPIQTNNEFMTISPFAWTEGTWPWDRRDF